MKNLYLFIIVFLLTPLLVLGDHQTSEDLIGETLVCGEITDLMTTNYGQSASRVIDFKEYKLNDQNIKISNHYNSIVSTYTYLTNEYYVVFRALRNRYAGNHRIEEMLNQKTAPVGLVGILDRINLTYKDLISKKSVPCAKYTEDKDQLINAILKKDFSSFKNVSKFTAPSYTNELIKVNKAICIKMGFKPDTIEISDCILSLYAKNKNEDK